MKKVYIEITNNCNLNCSFCIKNDRVNKFISIEEFKIILEKIKPYTKYIYLHVMGEALLHPKINELIDLASRYFNVNITTNGYLIDRIKTKNIRQINISIHSFDYKYKTNTEEYLNNIFKVVDKLDNTYISYRFWVNNKNSRELLDIINKHYNTNFKLEELKKDNKINDHIFINTYNEFIWPDLNNDYYSEEGKCYALRDHIGILVDGTVVPCCLDSKGIINLGNIYKDNLEDILNSDRVKKMLDGFRNNKKIEKLCKKCNFLDIDEV